MLEIDPELVDILDEISEGVGIHRNEMAEAVLAWFAELHPAVQCGIVASHIGFDNDTEEPQSD